jgi:hypothetical protein
MILTYLQDPGHGWVGCPMPLAQDLGFLPKVSRYSFVDAARDILWLEEDCDAGLLMRALADSPVRYRIREEHCPSDAYVRGLPRWEA